MKQSGRGRPSLAGDRLCALIDAYGNSREDCFEFFCSWLGARGALFVLFVLSRFVALPDSLCSLPYPDCAALVSPAARGGTGFASGNGTVSITLRRDCKLFPRFTWRDFASSRFLVRGSEFVVLSRFVALISLVSLGGISQAQGSWLGEKVEG